MIHNTAIVPNTVKVGHNVEIGPYAVVEDGVEIGDDSIIEAHAHLKRGARIGKNCTICAFTTISGDPQDLHFDKSIETFVEIGDGTTVREGATVHRATVPGGTTRVGKNCLLMANSHIGHDCVVGDRCILAPFCALGGFVRMGCDAFVSGGVMLHQRCVSVFRRRAALRKCAQAQYGGGNKFDWNEKKKSAGRGYSRSKKALYGYLRWNFCAYKCFKAFGGKGVFDFGG